MSIQLIPRSHMLNNNLVQMVQKFNFAYSEVFLLWKLTPQVLASAYNMEIFRAGKICIELCGK